MPIGRIIGDGSWAVDGVEIPSPTDFSVGHEGIQSKESGRSEDGYTFKEWVRDDVRYVDMTYAYLTGVEKDAIWNLVRGHDFVFDYYDNGPQEISSAYCNKFTYKGYSRRLNADEGGRYKDVKFRVVEN